MQRRNTVQKELVLRAVQELKCHATAEEVFDRVRKELPTVSRGTVYRNLNVLAEEGTIRRVSVPGEADRFDHTATEHYHVHCVRCGRVFDAGAGTLPDLKERCSVPGFVLLGCDVIFRGICPECNEDPKK